MVEEANVSMKVCYGIAVFKSRMWIRSVCMCAVSFSEFIELGLLA